MATHASPAAAADTAVNTLGVDLPLTPLSLALQWQSDWLAQSLAWQSAWLSSLAELQRQALAQDWTPPLPWLGWLVWYNGTEQLA